MSSASSETIDFVPEMVNRKPAVYRGMTFLELMIVIVIGSSIGASIGILVMLIVGLGWYIIPTGMLAVGWSSARLGGLFIAKIKRGKPETWLDRTIELKKSPSQFITQQLTWSIKRSRMAITRKKGNKK